MSTVNITLTLSLLFLLDSPALSNKPFVGKYPQRVKLRCQRSLCPAGGPVKYSIAICPAVAATASTLYLYHSSSNLADVAVASQQPAATAASSQVQ